jgi:DNA-binding transcriptional MerR regulator
MRIEKPKRKLVYPLREVCRLTGLSDTVIKRWEVQFPRIKPIRNRAANRSYLEKDLKLIFYIRDLIYVHKLDEESVREKLKSYQPDQDAETSASMKSLLAEVKMEIDEIRRLLESEE